MRNDYFFKVAGLLFSVNLPDDRDIEELLPSFRPFRCSNCPEGKRIFRLFVITQPFSTDGKHLELLSESSGDVGDVRLFRHADGYRIEIDYGTLNDGVHVMNTDSFFDAAMAFLRPEDPSVGLVLSSMLRILYAQSVLERGAVSVHASCVCMRGKSYLFLGKSGTGKSTHSRQWMKTFSDCHLLNDDNPVLRIEEDTVMAYGTPWSGKTPCYKNLHYPVAGIVRLRQSDTNRFTPLTEPETFAALLPSCSAIRQDTRLQDALYRTLIQTAEQVPVGRLECLPRQEAAYLCLESLDAMKNKDIEP